MSKKLVSIIVVVVLILIIIGIVMYSSGSPKPVGNGIQNTGTVNNQSSVTGLVSSPNDNSNAALENDMSSIDAQLNGLNGDTSNIKQSLDASSAQ